ncbi:MAG: hypothetical protein ACYC7L_02725 [Nitrospirota bacterium]
MTAHPKKAAGPDSQAKGNDTAKHPGADHDHDDDCRCKETSAMTPRQLLELMMRDLAFWKRPKKG